MKPFSNRLDEGHPFHARWLSKCDVELSPENPKLLAPDHCAVRRKAMPDTRMPQ